MEKLFNVCLFDNDSDTIFAVSTKANSHLSALASAMLHFRNRTVDDMAHTIRRVTVEIDE